MGGCSSEPDEEPAQSVTTVSPTVTVAPSQSPGQPLTLEAATAAGQEISDRYSSGDYGGAWDLYSSAFQDGIGREDYVLLGQTCSGANGSGLPIATTGVRMEGDDKAIVRLELMGVQQSRTMVYEYGEWRQEPSPEFAAQLGQPVQDIIAAQKASGGCQGG